jgi:uncharacterized membrane protein
MGEIFGVDGGILILAILALVVILLILIIIVWSKLSSLRKRYDRMLNGSSSTNVEELLIEMQNKLSGHKAQSHEHASRIEEIRETLKKMKSKVGIHRYNAFGDSGSDLSFSVAILDEYKDGILLTGIHSREQTYIYAKPIENGQSKYTLSPEEKETIIQTSKQP